MLGLKCDGKSFTNGRICALGCLKRRHFCLFVCLFVCLNAEVGCLSAAQHLLFLAPLVAHLQPTPTSLLSLTIPDYFLLFLLFVISPKNSKWWCHNFNTAPMARLLHPASFLLISLIISYHPYFSYYLYYSYYSLNAQGRLQILLCGFCP